MQEQGDLAARLADASAAARNAYRDTARLIRLLTVLSGPASPVTLRERTLSVLSEVFAADVVCLLEAVADRFVVTAARGIPADDPSLVEGFQLGDAAAEAKRTRQPVGRVLDPENADVPKPFAGLGLRSAAFVPVPTEWSDGAEASDVDLLVLYRSSGELFSGTDLHVLASVAQRLGAATQDRARAEAIEHLAHSGHVLARHLDASSLEHTAIGLLRQLTGSDTAWVVMVDDVLARQRDRSEEPTEYDSVVTSPAWHAAMRGRTWTVADPRTPSPPRAVLCVPVMRDEVPVALLFAGRDRPIPYRSHEQEIASIFASYFGTAVENARLYQELRRRATRDPLTGLANRDLVAQRLEAMLADGRSAHVGLLFCDLDGFKAVNDRLGHEAGDELLQYVALRLQGAVRSGDLLARFGGDEFVVVLGEVTSLAEVTDVGRRLVNAVSRPFILDGERVTVSASVGGVLGVSGRTTASSMLRDADAAMYAAKARGAGGVEVFDDAASLRSLDRLGLRSQISGALERGEFEVHYQPIVDLRTGHPTAFEALLRWTHPTRGPIPPDVFIPLAEETGEILHIGAWVLDQACRSLVSWKRIDGWRELAVSVNITAAELSQSGAPGHIIAVMRSAGVDPSDVWLEVTERSHAGDDVTAAAQRLRAAGVHLALDDFGNAYSNLAYLKRFPAECLKIDRSFVRGVATDRTNARIVRGILAIADSLGLSVVAEGVERDDDRDALLSLGCTFGQGFLYFPPVPATEVIELLRKGEIAPSLGSATATVGGGAGVVASR